MKQLDRLLLRQLLGTYLRVVIALVGIVIFVDLITARTAEILRFQVPLGAVFQYYTAFAWAIIYKYQVGAIGLLIAGLLVFGKAAQDNEITAALSAGISLRRIAAAPLFAGIAISLAIGLVSNTLGVRGFQRFEAVEQEYFKRYDAQLESYSWPRLGGGWSVHVNKFNRRALSGEGVLMHRNTPEAFAEIRAHRIYWEPEQQAWLLEDGRSSAFDKNDNWSQQTRRITMEAAPIVESPEILFALETRPEVVSIGELGRELRRAESLGLRVDTHWVDYWAKFAQPVLPAIMLLLAVPFAARLRRGGFAVSFGVGLALGLGYVALQFVGMGLGQLGELPPFAAAWLANIVSAALGLVLFLRTPT